MTMLYNHLGGGHSFFRIEVFVRSLAPGTARPQQEDLIRRLRTLEAEGDIETVDLYVTGDCVCESTAAAATDTGQFLLNRFERFGAWASEFGVDLVGFRDRCVDSTLTRTTVTGHQFPRIAVAVFDDDDLVLVTPCAENDAQHSVAELVTTLESVSDSAGEQDLSA